MVVEQYFKPKTKKIDKEMEPEISDFDYEVTFTLDDDVKDIFPDKLGKDMIFDKTKDGFSTYFIDKDDKWDEVKDDVIDYCKDDLVEVISNYFYDRNIYNVEYELFTTRFDSLLEKYDYSGFQEVLQEHLEEYHSVKEVLEMHWSDARYILDTIYNYNNRDVMIESKKDEDIWLTFTCNLWEDENNPDYLLWDNPCDDEMSNNPKNFHFDEDYESYDELIDDFFEDYDMAIQCVVDSDKCGENWDRGNYILYVAEYDVEL